ncbi:PHP domain-containing protein [Patescibacteria group bacterium]|nr:PHP domain-containing protein [Patescibacteria group bacterium]
MKADLHLHTNFSYDGLSSPREIVNSAISRKIDCICICDHGEIRGAVEALRFASSKPILIIPGIEVKSKEGDILGLNVKKIIEDGLSAKETIERIIKEGGMAVICHPFGWWLSFRGIEKFQDFFQEKGVAIEVFNASLLFNSSNKKALQFSEKLNLPFIAGSDAHSADFVGKAYLQIPGNNLSIKEVLEEIRKRNVKVFSEKISSYEKIVDHFKRNLAKIKHLKI